MESNQVNKIISKAIEYVKDPDSSSFGEVALGLYDLHRELNPVYSKYDRGPLTDWREIPLMPIGEFKKGDVGITLSDRMPFPGVEFHSSGTTQGDKSKHRMVDTEAYRASIAAGFKSMVDNSSYPKYRVILLTPTLPNSSLYYMMSYISELFDHRGIREQFEYMGDPAKTATFLQDLREEKEPVLLFGTSLAFYDFMSAVSGWNPLELPKGSMMIETGGWKGRDIKLTAQELTDQVQKFFGLPSEDCVREYSMSEISSQLYAWGDTGSTSYLNPDQLNVRLVDPLTQREVEYGESGIIAFVDLANVWSCPFILTEDIGHFVEIRGSKALVLEGRAVNAPEKGCSLTYAEAMGR